MDFTFWELKLILLTPPHFGLTVPYDVNAFKGTVNLPSSPIDSAWNVHHSITEGLLWSTVNNFWNHRQSESLDSIKRPFYNQTLMPECVMGIFEGLYCCNVFVSALQGTSRASWLGSRLRCNIDTENGDGTLLTKRRREDETKRCESLENHLSYPRHKNPKNYD